MTNSNNPPDVIVELSHKDAEILLDDCSAAIHQLLITIQENVDGRQEFIEKLCNLMEFKHPIMVKWYKHNFVLPMKKDELKCPN